MATISQRELRNDNAEVIRGVERGETYTVTRRGVPVAQLGPIPSGSDLRLVRPARKRTVFSAMRRVVINEPSSSIVAEVRGDR